MKKFFLCTLFALFAAFQASAKANQDFVGLLVSTFESQETNKETQKDYECITVSPDMMGKVLQMTEDNKDGSQINRVLRHVKSLRIFSVNRNSKQYYSEVQELLKKHKGTYSPYKAKAKDNSAPCIWLRKTGNQVIEIVMLNRTEDEGFQVVNLTGNMTKDFVTDLLKM